MRVYLITQGGRTFARQWARTKAEAEMIVRNEPLWDDKDKQFPPEIERIEVPTDHKGLVRFLNAWADNGSAD